MTAAAIYRWNSLLPSSLNRHSSDAVFDDGQLFGIDEFLVRVAGSTAPDAFKASE
jgi:hypothetical protein